jgi:hypothetical protein
MAKNSSKKSKKPRILLAILLIVVIGITAAILGITKMNSTDKYLGTWNYDQPNNHSMVNVATISGSSFTIPQIGTVTFSKGSNGQVIGHTDQGCTWDFTRVNDSLELTSPTQYCFNHIVNSGYNIYSWKVTVKGNTEQETLKATSFLPTGEFSFILQNGKRTKVGNESIASTFKNFVGTWNYEPANFKTQVNVVNVEKPLAGGKYAASQMPQMGSITFSQGTGNTIIAHTNDGCTWMLEAHGNTAELAPAAQTCTLASGTSKLSFFSVASNGKQQASIMTGTNAQGEMFQMTIGSLTKQGN